MRHTNILIVMLLLLSATQALALPDGHELYIRNCNACHQFQGAGGIGLPLTTKKFRDYSDDYLFKTIRHGRPGRVMPAFMEMSDAQVRAIIAFLRQQTKTRARIYDTSQLNGNPAHGKQLFQTHCVACHGSDGGGRGEGTGVTLSRKRAFLIMPPAISNPGFQAAASDRMIRQVIRVGRPQSGMPAFAEQGLSDQDIDALVAYVRELGKRAAKRPEMSLNEPPSHVTESPYDFETTVTNVKQAVVGANFRAFPDRFLEQGLIDEFSVNPRQIGIRFCNFNKLYDMLKIEPRLGVVLPCRITILERPDGKVLLVTPNLKVVSHWFNNDQLVELWERMEETFTDIIDEVTL